MLSELNKVAKKHSWLVKIRENFSKMSQLNRVLEIAPDRDLKLIGLLWIDSNNILNGNDRFRREFWKAGGGKGDSNGDSRPMTRGIAIPPSCTPRRGKGEILLNMRTIPGPGLPGMSLVRVFLHELGHLVGLSRYDNGSESFARKYMERILEPYTELFRCDLCGREFETRRGLYEHAETTHDFERDYSVLYEKEGDS